jgi:hypothetical protein
MFWAKQNDETDPESVLENHRKVNNPPDEGHLFAYQHKGKHGVSQSRPLTKKAFLKRVGEAAKDAGEQPLPRHRTRIRSTLEYLL